MSDREPVKSPCINVCALDENDVCIGCWRSAAEIAGWTGMTPAEQRAVVARADRRYQVFLEAARAKSGA